MDALYDLACNMEEGYYNGSLTIDDIPSIEGEDILVNAENPIDSSYIPSKVLQVHEFCGKKMDERQAVLTTPLCYIAFYLMRKDAMKNGIYPVIESSYRDYAYQNRIFNFQMENRLNKGLSWEEAFSQVSELVAKPGTSEHQTGLCFDIGFYVDKKRFDGIPLRSSQVIPGIDDYAYSSKLDECPDEFKWVQDNCYKYGFILRYPEGCKDITGYKYEAWHFRYVGKGISTYMHDNGINTFEEYCELRKEKSK